MSVVRFGVAFRLVAGLGALALFSVVVTATAFESFRELHRTIDAVTTRQLPTALIAAELGRRSEGLVAIAPALIVADSQFTREGVVFQINQQVDQVRALIARLEGSGGVDTGKIAALSSLADELITNLRSLDQQVERQLDAENGSAARRLTVRLLLDKVREATATERHRLAAAQAGGTAGTDAEAPAPDPEALEIWSDTMEQALTLMLASLAERELPRLQLLHKGYRDIEGRLGALPTSAGTGETLASLLQDVRKLGASGDGVFTARLDQANLLRQTQGTLRRNKILSDRLTAAVTAVIAEVETAALDDSAMLTQVVAGRSRLMIAASVVGAVLVVVIFLYIHRRVIRRLKELQESINAHVAGRNVPIPTLGDDELADMARALAFFVDAIHSREDALRSAKEQAEQALDRVERAQHQLIEAEKLAALGSLVAGVAHEINTPVGTVLTANSLLADRIETLRQAFNAGQVRKSDLANFIDTAAEATGIIQSNIVRAATLIQSFKQVAADRTSDQRRPFDLNHYIGEILLSLKPRLRETAVEVSVDCPDGLVLDSYPGSLSQVVTNFIMNSLMHGFDDGRTGHISLSARPLGPERLELRYGDDGKGIPASHLPRIFDPFFTTRRNSGGTGLGLHIVFNMVVQGLGGTIRVESTEGRGTTFILDLPRSAPAPDPAIAPATEPATEPVA